ncbi:hypothetical protein ACFWYW_58545 [Nonomuraea sp. NPDC059023]|uniref:hypothetical protein n=1 Tax=unclassified Nonomuraea TaxID=2593643 RepID=UPI00368C6004
MAWRLKTSVKVVNTCKKCKREYTNPFTHTCVVGIDMLGVPASMRKARAKKKADARKRGR